MPRPPKTQMPAGTCDTHAHICGPADAFPYAERRIYTPPDSTLSDYLDLLAALHIDRAVLIQPSVYGTDNRALLDALVRHNSGLRGVAVLSADVTEAEVRSLDRVGVRGIRLNVVDHDGERNVVPIELSEALGKINCAVRLAHRISNQS